MNVIRAIFLCFTFLLASNSWSSEKLIIDEKNNTIKTSKGTYSIKPDETNDSKLPKCITKGNDWLMCTPQDLMTWGKPIQTRNFNIFPLYSSCSGSGCSFSSTTLLIESNESLYLDMGLISFDLSAGKVENIDYENDEVDLILNRTGGEKQFAAKFIKGKIVPLNAKLDAKEKIQTDECDWLYNDFMSGCIEAKKYDGCYNVLDSMAMVYQRGVYGMINDYRGFPKEKLTKLCDSTCLSGTKPQRSSFQQHICRW